MENIINKNNVASFARTNADILEGTPHAVLLDFHGLSGGTSMIKQNSPLAVYCASVGVLYVMPYYGPWSWMNDKAVTYVDRVVNALFELYALDDATPIISSGNSMGGLSAIVYCRYAKRTSSACAAICPVCDLPFHLTERDDLPRTLYNAFLHYDCTFDEALCRTSPLHLGAELPDIPFLIFHGTRDGEVRKDMHSDRFVARLEELGRNVEYVAVPDRDHCEMTEESTARFHAFIASF